MSVVGARINIVVVVGNRPGGARQALADTADDAARRSDFPFGLHDGLVQKLHWQRLFLAVSLPGLQCDRRGLEGLCSALFFVGRSFDGLTVLAAVQIR